MLATSHRIQMTLFTIKKWARPRINVLNSIMEMKYLFSLLIILGGMYAYPQHRKSTNPDGTVSSQTAYGTFENYAFVLNGKIIQQHALVDYPGATLDQIFPYVITLEGREYRGAVYFHTLDHPAPPAPYADDPAWFINGTQVSPFDIRSSRPELYSKIKKSTRDTVINGTRYKGAIHVATEEDFFAERISLPELLGRYTDLHPEHTTIHWRSVNQTYTDGDDLGTIIRDHFPIYHIDNSQWGLRKVKVDRIRFAEGERYIVHLLDNGYKWGARMYKWRGPEKAQTIFKDPLAVDTACPCYLTNFDKMGQTISHSAELRPEPYGGEEVYLKKLSDIMSLPAEKPTAPMVSDSLTVQFIVTRTGMLVGLESNDSDKLGHLAIIDAIKQHSCTWSIAQNAFPFPFRRKMTIVYSKVQSGNIQSLDALKFKYDEQ